MASARIAEPTPRDLRTFGWLLPLVFGVVGSLIAWQAGWMRVAAAVWAIGAALSLVYLLQPRVRRFLYLGWMTAVYPIGWTLMHLLLAGVYFLLLTPMALLFRMLGRDTMRRRFESSAPTYWEERDVAADTERCFRQF